MNEKFVYSNLSNSQYDHILFSTSIESNVSNKRTLLKTIKTNNLHGKILIDLLLANGNSFNRYVEIIAENFTIKELKIIKKIDFEIKESSLDFYNENISLLKNSILTPYLRKCIELKRSF